MPPNTNQTNNQVVDKIHALLEKNLIEAYLRGKGYTLADLEKQPAEVAKRLKEEASTYASCKLAEIDIRAHFVTELHDAYTID
ncbi:MAG: hypothetical protein ACOYYU_11380 [Chloroflexota bacterium]